MLPGLVVERSAPGPVDHDPSDSEVVIEGHEIGVGADTYLFKEVGKGREGNFFMINRTR